MSFKAKILFLISIELCIISQFGKCKCDHSIHGPTVGIDSRIGCFVCSSRNASNPDCEDPFHPGLMNGSYVESCKVPKRKHIGEFPAHFCIKVIGTSYSTNEKVVVRRCTTYTMENQCGNFHLQDELFRGCVLTCNLDGCNSAVQLQPQSFPWIGAMASSLLASVKIIQPYLTNVT